MRQFDLRATIRECFPWVVGISGFIAWAFLGILAG